MVIRNATWYKIQYIYNAVKGINELFSEGIIQEDIESFFKESWQEGNSGVVGIQTNFLDITEDESIGLVGPMLWNKIVELY